VTSKLKTSAQRISVTQPDEVKNFDAGSGLRLTHSRPCSHGNEQYTVDCLARLRMGPSESRRTQHDIK